MRLVLPLLALLAAPLRAEPLDDLFAALKAADQSNWQALEDRIWAAWSQSGSPAMDLLLERGRLAIAEGDPQAAIEHLTAVVENAPAFAEGYNARATAYFHAGLYGPAMADLATTLNLEPRHFGALTGLARILEETGNPARAIAAYEAALAIHPARPDLREALESVRATLEGEDI